MANYGEQKMQAPAKATVVKKTKVVKPKKGGDTLKQGFVGMGTAKKPAGKRGG